MKILLTGASGFVGSHILDSHRARGLPTAVTLACPDEALGEALARTLATPTFRPYWIADLIGALHRTPAPR